MNLIQANATDLYFPETEWQWLKKPQKFDPTAPDSFLWGVTLKQSDKTSRLWVWHPEGGRAEFISATNPVSVFILKTDGSELEGFGLYLKTTFSKHQTIDVEWTNALDVLEKRLKFNIEEKLPPFWSETLMNCGLEPHLGVLAQRRRYVFLTLAQRQLLFDHRWDLATLELIESLSPAICDGLNSKIEKLGLTASAVREVSHYLIILVKKFGEKAALAVLNTPHQSAEEFRSSILRTSQPELAHLMQTRLDRLRALKLPIRTSVFGDPSFEKEGLKITHTPRHIADFDEFKSWVENQETYERLKTLLEIYQ